jgi:high-affinity iron transporter
LTARSSGEAAGAHFARVCNGRARGIETGLFIFGITQTSTPLQVTIGAALGVAAAVALGYTLYAGDKRINLGAFFKVTGVILILVAAGLLAHGVAEFEEAALFRSSSRFGT